LINLSLVMGIKENNIPSIYNYCDRWCEKCAFTSRCLNYKFGERLENSIDNQDEINKLFWELFDDNLEDTYNVIERNESKSNEFIEKVDDDSSFGDNYDFNIEDDDEDSGDDFRLKHLIAESNEAAILSKEYINLVTNWFKNTKEKIGDEIDEFILSDDALIKLSDAIEVIQWYYFFIYPKVMRALQGKDEDLFEDEFPKDSDGSAKIALIAVERSISAWGYVYMKLNAFNDSVYSIIQQLVNLQHAIEAEFPNARNFIRPGFDEINNK